MLAVRTYAGPPDCLPDGPVLRDCSVVEEILEEALALLLLARYLSSYGRWSYR